MDTFRVLVAAFALFLTPISHATAILTTDFGVVSATVGSAYPDLPGSPVYSDHIVSGLLASGFTSQEYSSTPLPNYGWVSWSASEQYLRFQAGQEVCIFCGIDQEGYGFSSLDLLWVFSVDGDGGALEQNLFSGTGSVQSILVDITDPSTYINLSVSPGFNHVGDTLGLLDDHRYLLYASLDNQALGDGFEAEYTISLENASISIPEPETALLLLLGLGLMVSAHKSASAGNPA